MTAAPEVLATNTGEASVSSDPYHHQNAVLAWLDLPDHLKVFPDVLPDRTVHVLRSLYPDAEQDPEDLLRQAVTAVNELSNVPQRIECRFKIAGFDKTTLELAAPNLRQSWQALRRSMARARLGVAEIELSSALKVIDTAAQQAVGAEVVIVESVPAEYTAEPTQRDKVQSLLVDTLGIIDEPTEEPATIGAVMLAAEEAVPVSEPTPSFEPAAREPKQVTATPASHSTVEPTGATQKAVATTEPTKRKTIVHSGPAGKTAPLGSLEASELLGIFGLPEEQSWQERALCVETDPEAFFPEKGGSTREAKKICVGCEVRDECLEYALMHEERFGIWGGLSERERRRIKRRVQ